MVKKLSLLTLALFSLFLCVGLSPAWGEEPSKVPADLSADDISFEVVDGKNVIIAKGNVHVAYGGVELSSDYAEFRKDENKVFARGNIVIRNPQYEVKAEEGEYDFNQKIGTLKKGSAVYLPEGWQGEMYCKGESVRAFPDMLILEKGQFTTCDKTRPHYTMAARRIVVFPGKSVVGKHATFRIGGLPLLYFPYAKKSLQRTHFRVYGGHRGLLGMFGSVAYYHPIPLGEETMSRWKMDVTEKQGVGFGVKVDSKWSGLEGGRGDVEGYYITGGEGVEMDPRTVTVVNPDGTTTQVEEETPNKYEDEGRWLVKGNIMERLTEELIFKGRADIFSDEDVLKHFYWKDYRKDPTVETYASLAWMRDKYAVYGLADVNVMDFEEDVERLPQFDFDWKKSMLYNTGILMDFNSQFADLSNGLVPQWDEEGGMAAEVTAATDEEETNSSSQQDVEFIRSDRGIVRFDQTAEVSRPFRVADVVAFEPKLKYEGTYYSDLYRQTLVDPGGEPEPEISGSDFRNAVTGQVQTRTDFFKIYEGDLWVPGAALLRHEIEPTLTYAYRPDPTVGPEELIQFDKVDALEATNSVTAALVNRWEKKDVSGKSSQVARVDLGVTEEMEEGQKSFASLKMWLTIWELWDFRTDTRYDIAAGELARCNSSVGLHPHERVDLKFGDVYYPRLEGDDNLDVNATMILKIMEGLSLSCEAIYDTNEADLEEMEFSIQKSLHCWDTILSYSKRREDDEQQVAFGLCLRAVPDFNFHFSGGFGGVE